MVKNYKGGFACIELGVEIPAGDNVIVPGIYDAIKASAANNKPVLMQNVKIKNLAAFTGYVTFTYDATNTAYIGNLANITDYDGNGMFISLFIIVDNDNYVWVNMIQGDALIPKATTSKEGTVKKCSKVTDATSETIVAQFNDLLSKMKTAGMMSN